jgi:hypothetical protein
MIARWVAFTSREIDARPLRLVQVLVAVAILGDLLAVVRRGALEAVLLPASLGGMSETFSPSAWFPESAWAGPTWFGVLGLSMVFVLVGPWPRAALLVGVVSSAQLGHMYMPGDRAIDRILRTVMLLLLFSRASDARPPARIAAWPADLLRWLLVLVYLQAGIAKLDARPGFLDPELPELYAIMAEPLVGRLDPLFWRPYPLLFVAGGAATLALELSAPLLLTRWCRWWAVAGAALHLGLVATMELGMFPFGMLALYPVLLSPWTEQLLDRAAPYLPAGLRARWGPPEAAPVRDSA